MDTHIPFCASHQNVTLWRTRHGVTVEIELRHIQAGHETSSDHFYAVRLTFNQKTEHIAARGAEPVGAVVVTGHSLNDVIVAADEVECVLFLVEDSDAVGVGKQHQLLLPVCCYVNHHLAHPLLCALLIAEGHIALAVLEVITPQTVNRGDIHAARVVIAQGVAMDVVTAVGGDDAGTFVVGVEDDSQSDG